MENTKIGWTDHSFNPWTGCQRVSEGCVHCYAEVWAKRTGRDLWGAKIKRKRTGKSLWAKPKTWNRLAAEGHLLPDGRRVRRVFCASLADVFEDAPGPNEWRDDVWALIRACPWLDWQLLTKRPENIAGMLPADWGEGWPNVWLGTSIEDWRVVDRARTLAAVPAYCRFISYEPAIGPVFHDLRGPEDSFFEVGHPGSREGVDEAELDLDGIDWLICGGESGPGRRPMQLEWARAACHAAFEAQIAFFFKQISAAKPGQGEDALGAPKRGFPAAWDRTDLDKHPVFAAEGSLFR